MFTSLGRTVNHHPVVTIVIWISAALLAAAAAFSGFGQGGIFDRLGTMDKVAPGTDAQAVMDIQAKSKDYPLIAVVTGTKAERVDGAAASEVARRIADLPGVTEVAIPPALAHDARAQAEKQADAEVTDQLQRARAEAERSAREAVAALVARGVPEQVARARVAAQAEQQRAAQPSEAEIRAKARQTARDKADAAVRDKTAPLVSERGYVISVTLRDDARVAEHEQRVVAELRAATGTLAPGGSIHITSKNLGLAAVNETVRADLFTGEVIGLPIALLLMVLVFGGLVAAIMPLLGAGTAITVALGLLWAGTFATTIESFVLNVISIIAVALSIDYGLLVVSRYREELGARLERAHLQVPRRGERPSERYLEAQREALAATIGTAGRTVTFSAVTIAAAISGLFAINIPLLRVLAAGGIAAALLSVLSAITLIPAILTLLGPRIARPAVIARVPGLRWLLEHMSDTASTHGAFARIAGAVQRIPWTTMLGVLAALVVLMIPLKDGALRLDLSEIYPKDSDPGIVSAELNAHYSTLATPEITVLVRGDAHAAEAEAARIRGLAHVTSVSAPAPSADGYHALAVHLDVEDAVGRDAVATVKQIRAHAAAPRVLVGGNAALQSDFNAVLAGQAWRALAIMSLAVLVLLWFMTGSVVIPLKALITNSISLSASMGLTMWIFYHGIFGLPAVPGMTTFVVALGLAFGFGLSMDYEVFLIARMKEYWDAGHSNDDSVRHGLQSSGRIITSAAAIIVAVFVGFSFGHTLSVREIGVMLAVCVVIDATLVRVLLVPATMTVLGRWNWWAPRWMERIYEKLGVSETNIRWAQDAGRSA